MNFAFHPDAEDEFNSAIDYYENIEFRLGVGQNKAIQTR